VKRREFARLLAVTGAAAAGLDLDRWAAVLGGSRIDGPTLDDMATVTADQMRRAATLTPYALLPAVRGHLQGICQALAWTPAGLAARAHSLAGQTALLAGYLMLQQESRPQAHEYWLLAERFGEMAGDTQLLAALRVVQAWRWEDDDRPLAIALLNRAESLLGPDPDPASAAMVLSTRAFLRARASSADSDSANAALAVADLDNAQSSLSRMDAAHDGLYIFRSVTSQAMEYRANALLHLGRPSAAVAGFEQALDTIDPSSLAWRSFVTTPLAAAIAGMGDPEHACEVFGTSLDLAASASSPRCARLVRDWQQRWLAGYDGPAAGRLDERLRALALPSPADRPDL
jgi:tetratricopeptide (TPR) repeat protein